METECMAFMEEGEEGEKQAKLDVAAAETKKNGHLIKNWPYGAGQTT